MPTADYLWKTKKIVPFLKVDKGLKDLKDGVRLMKDIPNLRGTLKKATEYAGEDADVTFRLYDLLKRRLDSEKLTKIYEIFEKPMIGISMG